MNYYVHLLFTFAVTSICKYFPSFKALIFELLCHPYCSLLLQYLICLCFPTFRTCVFEILWPATVHFCSNIYLLILFLHLKMLRWIFMSQLLFNFAVTFICIYFPSFKALYLKYYVNLLFIFAVISISYIFSILL